MFDSWMTWEFIRQKCWISVCILQETLKVLKYVDFYIVCNPIFYQMGDPIQLKDEGNKYFQSGDIDKAIECYTKAIKECKDKKELAVIHRNRSACYLKKVGSLWSRTYKH